MVMGSKGYKKGHKMYMKEYWKSRPREYLLAAAKRRAKVLGQDFSISVDDIVIPETCPILEEPLTQVHNGPNKEFSPCLDRIDNNKGYIPGNVAVISFRANRIKGNLTKETIDKLQIYVSNSG